jgi:hypothetical protein
MTDKATLEEIEAEYRNAVDPESGASYRQVAASRFNRLLEICREQAARIEELEGPLGNVAQADIERQFRNCNP